MWNLHSFFMNNALGYHLALERLLSSGEWFLYKSWKVFSEILYYYYSRTSTYWYKNVVVGNVARMRFTLTVLIKFAHWASEGRYTSWSCSSNHACTGRILWMGALLSWKIASWYGNRRVGQIFCIIIYMRGRGDILDDDIRNLLMLFSRMLFRRHSLKVAPLA